MIRHVFEKPVAHFARRMCAAKVARGLPFAHGCAHGRAQQVSQIVPANVIAKHSRCKHGAHGIGDALPGDIWRRAVHRLE